MFAIDNKKSNPAFTLIELLIVVSAIAILTAIALPNLLKAQIRTKASRVKAELKTLAVALEAYHTDNNSYPIWMKGTDNITPNIKRLVPLSTPIGYVTDIPERDPFQDENHPRIYDAYDYVDAKSMALSGDPEPAFRVRGAEWRLCSAGPDRVNTFGGPSYLNSIDNPGYDYDPTNGILSRGDIVLVGPKSHYAGRRLYPDKIE